MTEFRTVKRNGRTYRIPIRESQGSSNFIQKSIKHPGRVREYLQRTYGSEAFDEKGRIKAEYLIKAKQKAEEQHNRSLVDAIDLAMRLKKMDSNKDPYGEPKSEATEQARKLREEGEHVRVIETNKKNEKYAPFVGDIEKNNEQKTVVDNAPQKTEQNEQRQEDNHGIIRVNRSKGYTGKTRHQGWVSEPLRPGEHSRVFVEPDHMDWGDSELYRKNKGEWDAVYHLPPDRMYDMNYGGGAPTQSIVTWKDKKRVK